MPRYQVPQFIDIEDKIIGPLTLRQFLYFLAAAAILFIFWTLLAFEYFVVIAIITVGLAGIFSFVKIHGRSFTYFISNFISFIFKSQKYIWKKEKTLTKETHEKDLPPKVTEQPIAKKDISESRLKKLAWKLDIKEDTHK